MSARAKAVHGDNKALKTTPNNIFSVVIRLLVSWFVRIL